MSMEFSSSIPSLTEDSMFLSWNTVWDDSSSASELLLQFEDSIQNFKFHTFYHRNSLKQTSNQSFFMEKLPKKLKCIQILSKLRSTRNSLLQSIDDMNNENFNESFKLLCNYLNLLYGLVWSITNKNEIQITNQSTSKLSNEFEFKWSDSLMIDMDQMIEYRIENDTIFELISIIYQFALKLILIKNNGYENYNQKCLQLSSILFRIINENFLSLASPLTILTESFTDLHSKISLTYQFQILAEERELELFKWIRSKLNEQEFKWPKILELSSQIEWCLQQSLKSIESKSNSILIKLWSKYLNTKYFLYHSIRLIHTNLMKFTNYYDYEYIDDCFNESKQQFQAYNLMKSSFFNDDPIMGNLEIFDWIEQQIYRMKQRNLLKPNDDIHSNHNQQSLININSIQSYEKIEKIAKMLFKPDKLWTKKIYDAFGYEFTFEMNNIHRTIKSNYFNYSYVIDRFINWKKLHFINHNRRISMNYDKFSLIKFFKKFDVQNKNSSSTTTNRNTSSGYGSSCSSSDGSTISDSSSSSSSSSSNNNNEYLLINLSMFLNNQQLYEQLFPITIEDD